MAKTSSFQLLRARYTLSCFLVAIPWILICAIFNWEPSLLGCTSLSGISWSSSSSVGSSFPSPTDDPGFALSSASLKGKGEGTLIFYFLLGVESAFPAFGMQHSSDTTESPQILTSKSEGSWKLSSPVVAPSSGES